jgi:hypothetical protein
VNYEQWVLWLAPSVVGMLVSFSLVQFVSLSLGKTRPHNAIKVLIAMTAGGLGCWLAWDVIHGGVDRQGAVVSLLTGVITPGAWRIVLAVVKGRWPKVYAALKVKPVVYSSDVAEQDEDDTTIFLPSRRSALRT